MNPRPLYKFRWYFLQLAIWSFALLSIWAFLYVGFLAINWFARVIA